MITEEDIKRVEEVKKMLQEKIDLPLSCDNDLPLEFNWDLVNQIETLDRMVRNLKKAELSFKFEPPGSRFWTAECSCGWWGSSELLEGGQSIADTGDYEALTCPVCMGEDTIHDKKIKQDPK